MKKLFFLAIVSGAILLPAFSYSQQKYIYKPSAARVYKAQVNSNIRPRLTVSDPPIINDPIDIYADNPALLNASITIHFGDITAPSTNTTRIQLFGNPDYTYHTADHIIINTLMYCNISSNMGYTIPLFSNSDNHWTVTYNDFLDKWVDGAHTHLDFNNRVNQQGGMIDIYQAGMSGSITKLTLVLKFASGTKTIVWNKPKSFNKFIDFKFDQNFNPMN